MVGLLAVVAPLAAQTYTSLVNESFSDAERQTQALPTSMQWYYAGNAGNGTRLAVAPGGGAVTYSVPSAGPAGAWSAKAYFTNAGTAVQLGEGDRLRLRFQFALSTLVNSSAALRFGLFSSEGNRLAGSDLTTGYFFVGPAWNNYVGYAAQFNAGGTTGFDVIEKIPSSNTSLFTGAALPPSTAQAMGLTANTFAEAEIEAVRTANTVTLTAKVNGRTVSRTDETGIFVFDTLGVFAGTAAVPAGQSITFRNFVVESTVAPRAYAPVPFTGYFTVVENAPRQVWDGFGASLFNLFTPAQQWSTPEAREKLYDLLFSDLKVHYLRFILRPNFQTSAGGAYNITAALGNFPGQGTDTKYIFDAARARTNGTLKPVGTVLSPPAYMKESGRTTGGGADNRLLPEFYDDFATYMKNYVLRYQESTGIPLSYLSLQNEPTFNTSRYDTNNYTAEEYVDMLKVVVPEIRSIGPRTPRILAPDHAYPDNAYYSKVLAEAGDYFDIGAVHSYAQVGGAESTGIVSNIVDTFTKPLWQTERSYSSGLDDFQVIGSTQVNYGMNLVREFLQDIVSADPEQLGGARSWFWFNLANTQPTFTGAPYLGNPIGESLIHVDANYLSPQLKFTENFLITKKYYAFRALTNTVHAGMRRMKTTNTVSFAGGQAFRAPSGAYTVVVQNFDSQAKILNIEIKELAGSGSKPFTRYRVDNVIGSDPATLDGVTQVFVDGKAAVNMVPYSIDVYTQELSPIENWRRANLANIANAGDSANTADPDLDGLPNLLEYALGTNPNFSTKTGLPVASTDHSGQLTLNFVRAQGNVEYVVEGSADLSNWSLLATNPGTPGSLVSVTDSGSGPVRFVRLRVNFEGDTVVSAPYGRINYALTANRVATVGFPLVDAGTSISGNAHGVITAVNVSSLGSFAANWTAGELSQASNPHLLRITSGAAKGRLFEISTSVANTRNTVTLNTAGVDLRTLGIVAHGDTYEIVRAETLGSLFPAGTLLSGSASAADVVQLYRDRIWVSYYHDGAGWRAVADNSNASNLVVRPDEGLIIQRRGPTVVLSMVGVLPAVDLQVAVPRSASTVITLLPIAQTFDQLALQNVLPGWSSNPANVAAGDHVLIWNGSAWLRYFYQGATWLRQGGPASGGVPLNVAGRPFLIVRPSGSGTDTLHQAKTY